MQLDHIYRLNNDTTPVPYILLYNDVEGNPIILNSKNGATAFHPSTTYDINDLNAIGQTFRFEINNDGTDLTNKMYPFTALESSEKSNDNTNTKGTQDKDLLG